MIIAALVLAVALVAAGALYRTLTHPAGAPSPSLSAAPVGPPTPVAVAGGDVGKEVALKAANGSTATVAVKSATWTPEGQLRPQPGTSYLLVEVELTGKTGSMEIASEFTVAIDSAGRRYGVAFGPTITQPLRNVLLHTGEKASGQLGFQLPPGDVKLEFQDPSGGVLGTVQIPGP